MEWKACAGTTFGSKSARWEPRDSMANNSSRQPLSATGSQKTQQKPWLTYTPIHAYGVRSNYLKYCNHKDEAAAARQ
ncbi:hypothetical protein PoMZ_11683 [Pyricularia oryzae]|uniref:Uncharacterized protein n=1 Tax=Pyricularia oryzae TaxID=318829 RepID=A0A4P7NL82_PYROR|nr:hypothetical protein PoMZ_11683 [Pyricularia oryzae]